MEPGYVVQQPLLASPWDWGRTVMTGAMAEHEELEYIKPRLASIEQQMIEIREVFIPQLIAETEERIITEMEAGMKRVAKESYWRGFRSGVLTSLLFGGAVYYFGR